MLNNTMIELVTTATATITDCTGRQHTTLFRRCGKYSIEEVKEYYDSIYGKNSTEIACYFVEIYPDFSND